MFVFNTFPAICAISFVSFVVLYIFYLEFFAFDLPKDLPSVGFRHEVFSTTRASVRQIFKSPEVAEEGYKKYGQNNRTFVVPHASFRPQVMLPQEHIKWLVAQQETVLNAEVVRLDRQGIDYFPLSADSKTNLMAAHKIIGEGLNKNLDALQPAIYDGIQYAIDKALGTDTTEWHEFPLMETVSTFLDGVVTRVIFGANLSRDEGFLKLLRAFIIGGGVLTDLVGQVPLGLFRALLAFPVGFFTLVLKKLSIAYLRPEIKERLLKIEKEKDGKSQPGESYDFMTQCIRTIKNLKFPTQVGEAAFVADILMFLALAAVVSTRTTTVHAFLDILGPGAKQDTYGTLRKEAETIIKSESDWIDPSSLKSMTNIDSALRESARVNPLQTRGLLKQVMPKEGIDLPDGMHVSQGTWLGVAIEAIHRDETIYPNALQFDALRFARLNADDSTKNLDFARASDTYMFFSYGRSMCPGRWFATRVMKLIFAYVTLHYDIKPLTEHSERVSLGDTKLHRTSVKMVVRRRKVAEKSSK